MNKLMKLQNRKAAIAKEMRALTDKAEAEDRAALTEDETKELAALEQELSEVVAGEAREKRLQEIEKSLKPVADPNALTDQQRQDLTGEQKPKNRLPVSFLRTGKIKSFTGPKAEENAYLSGMWFRATLFNDEQAKLWCQDHGVKMLAQSSGTNTAGGYLVPDELSQAIIDLRETYGVFRREARVLPMGSETMHVPRRTGGLTAYFVAENTATTDSSKSWGQVELVAKELSAMVLYPNTLADDAVINLADDLAGEIAYAFSLKEDQCGFIGDGTSTYGGMHGASVKVNDGNHAGSIVTAITGNTAFSTLDLADFHSVVGKLPLYARMNAKWYISAPGYSDSMERLMYAAGGNTVSTIGGGSGPSFLGYPVVFSQVLNSVLTADTAAIKLLFGDLRAAATLGDRRGISVASSREYKFAERQTAILGTERFDINVHELGDATNAGALVALKTPGS